MTAKNETFDMDIELVHSLFEYRDGALYWKSDVARNVKAGDRVANYPGNGNVSGTYTYANTGTAIVLGFTANSTYTA